MRIKSMELSELKNFDYLIILITSVSVYFGWKTGFIESFIGFFAWAGSAIIVADNYSKVYSVINGYISSKFISGFLASLGFYIILVILILYVGTRLSKATSKVGGGGVDKVCGSVFGTFRGALIAIALFWVCYTSYYALNDKKIPDWLSKAKSYKVLKLGSDSVSSIFASEEERKKILDMIMRKAKDAEKEVKDKSSSLDEE